MLKLTGGKKCERPWGLKCERIPDGGPPESCFWSNRKASQSHTFPRHSETYQLEIVMLDFLLLPNRRTTRPIASTRSLNWSVPAPTRGIVPRGNAESANSP